MSNFVQRAGSVHIRVGGNTQETASIVDSLPNGKIMSKDYLITGNPASPSLFPHLFLYSYSYCHVDQNTHIADHPRFDIYDGEYIGSRRC